MTDHDFNFLVAAVLAIGILGSWIWGTFHSAQNRQWGWFVMVLLFSPIASVIYLLVVLFGSKRPPGDRPPWAH
jgi:hypothetical protein